MNITLIQPPTEHILRTQVPKMVESRSGVLPPLGLLYLAGMFDTPAHRVSLLDCDAERLGAQGIAERLQALRPGLVGITATSFTIVDALIIASIVKQLDPHILVVIGGPHGSIYPAETAALPNVDYVVQGEGEYVFPELVRVLERNADPAGLAGIACRRGGVIAVNRPPAPIDDLDALPFPDRSRIPAGAYFSLLSQNKRITTMASSRGCPFTCTFCYRHTGSKFRAHSPERVVEEMARCEREGYEEVFMIDDTFTADRRRVLAICAAIRERGIAVGWDARANIHTLDPEVITAMKEAGCLRLHIGIEAGTPEISKVLCKNIDLEKAKKTFRFIRSAGMQTLAYFMIGSPTETRGQVLRTIAYAVELDPDFAQFAVTTPFPATPLYARGLSSGLFREDHWKLFAQRPAAEFKPPYWTEQLSERELEELVTLAHRRFYVRPRYILKALSRVRSLTEFKRKAMAGLDIAFSFLGRPS